jgi:predicted  nucleic acid-binding Zn-ribbon protein
MNVNLPINKFKQQIIDLSVEIDDKENTIHLLEEKFNRKTNEFSHLEEEFDQKFAQIIEVSNVEIRPSFIFHMTLYLYTSFFF